MSSTWTRFLAILAISWGMSGTAFGQQPPPPPPPPGPITPAPAPTPLPAPEEKKNADPAPAPAPGPVPAQVAPGAITVTTPSVTPGMPNGPAIGSGGSCSPTPLICGGCLESFLPKCGCGGGTWIVGGGVYYMAPVYNSSNHAFTTSSTVGATTTTHQTDFSNSLNIGPIGFVGYSWGNGWGVRFRWFQYIANDSAGTTFDGLTSATTGNGLLTTPVPPATGSTLNTTSHLYIQAYDLEATYNTTIGKWLLIGSAGARYGQISQGYGATFADKAGVVTATTESNHSFGGFGPTVSLEGHRQIGDSNFAVYASARGSVLFGHGDLSSASSIVGGATTAFSTSQNNVIPVGELEIGGEWSKAWGRFRLFAQVGVVGQIWWGAGSASDIGTGNGSPSNLGFIGGVARAGIGF